MMKILFWMSGSFDRRTPSEHLLTAMIEALYAKGHTVHIIQKDTGGPLAELPECLKALGVTTTCVPSSMPKKSNFIARYLADMKYVSKSAHYIKRQDSYEAVFMQSTNVAGFAIRALKSKTRNACITYNVQDIFPYNAAYSGSLVRGGIVFKVFAAIQRYAYKKADYIITISEDMRDLLVEDGVPREKIEVIYNWNYRDEPYIPAEVDCTKARDMFPKDKFNVVYAGNIGVMQNVDVIVSAAELMKDDDGVQFHIIGDGTYKDKLKRRAEEHGIVNLSFHPMLPSEFAPSIYLTADVNIIPLVKNVYKTALPSKTATCFACGKPIIFCIGKDSKFAQMAYRETGCQIVESGDTDGLKNAILSVMQGTNTSRYGRFFTEKLGKTTNSENYAEIITRNK